MPPSTDSRSSLPNPIQPAEKDLRYRSFFEACADGLIVSDAQTGLVIEANPAAAAMHGYACEDLIGMPVARLIPPDINGGSIEAALTARSVGRFDALAVHLRRDGSSFPVEAHWAAFTHQGRPSLLGVLRDVSARVQAEHLLQHQVKAHAREQATLLEISQTLASALELKPGLILDQLRVLIEYTHAGLFVLEGLALDALAVRGPTRLDQAMPFHILLDDPRDLAVFSRGRQPNRIGDVWSVDPAAQALRGLVRGRADALLEGIHAWMWVPLMVKDRTIGGVTVAHTEPDFFTAHHVELVLMMANQAAITLVNAQLYQDARALAKLQERQRLAHDLHDAVNQSLFSAGLIAEVLPRLWERDPVAGRRSLEDLRLLTRGALAEMRGLLAELRPAVLTGTELGDLLRQLGDALTGRTNIPVHVTVLGQGGLPADVQVALYRLCQEALSNVAKHAGASAVSIHLQYDLSRASLHIRDDGRGFDPDHTPSGHSGLSMMRERAEAIGAALSITSEAGQGTEVAIQWAETPEPQTQ